MYFSMILSRTSYDTIDIRMKLEVENFGYLKFIKNYIHSDQTVIDYKNSSF